MRALLDTHALLWWLAGDERLSPAAHDLIANESTEIFVSAASVSEVVTKHRIGKLPHVGPLVVDFARVLQSQQFIGLAISIDHAQTAGALRDANRDPFDRMLISQAMLEKMALVSNERSFDAFPITRVW